MADSFGQLWRPPVSKIVSSHEVNIVTRMAVTDDHVQKRCRKYSKTPDTKRCGSKCGKIVSEQTSHGAGHAIEGRCKSRNDEVAQSSMVVEPGTRVHQDTSRSAPRSKSLYIK